MITNQQIDQSAPSERPSQARALTITTTQHHRSRLSPNKITTVNHQKQKTHKRYAKNHGPPSKDKNSKTLPTQKPKHPQTENHEFPTRSNHDAKKIKTGSLTKRESGGREGGECGN
ncbi:hypothetical protein MLD38_026741 [Melastoma candidum]|uniref:Uncharacterized protein n=1 Tax=Melastoma candidum TaxID=119954 RepID=A0ACB9P014_9MYRT|nr:hypothetical protein MLD38_026741 [Melastoma candidum]